MDSELLERADEWVADISVVGVTSTETSGMALVEELVAEIRRQGEDVDGFTTVLCDLVLVMDEVGQANTGGHSRLRLALRRAASDATTGRAATVVNDELEAAASGPTGG